MRLKIHHTTIYDYPHPVASSVNEVWLRPLTDERQSCLSFSLTTVPRSDPRPYSDYYGNTVYHFDIPAPHSRLEVTADAEVITQDVNTMDVLRSDPSPRQPLSPLDRDRWLDFLAETPLTTAGEGIRAFARSIGEGRSTVAGVVLAVADRVRAVLRYQGGVTNVMTPAEDAYGLQCGVCQDYTHLFLTVCRQLGVPARYVSGYLSTGGGADEVQSSHAWPEALLPVAGWVGFDVTNGCPVDGRYVRVAVGRDYADVPPIRGAFSGRAGTAPDVAVYVVDDQQQQQQQQ